MQRQILFMAFGGSKGAHVDQPRHQGLQVMPIRVVQKIKKKIIFVIFVRTISLFYHKLRVKNGSHKNVATTM